MTSDRKVAANRANAKKSTGARTKEGKRASSQNAWKHGIWAKQLNIPEGDRQDYNLLVADLGRLLRPEGPILQYYFDEIVVCMWRLRMLVPIESRQLLPLPEDSKRSAPFKPDTDRRNAGTQANVLDELRKRVENEQIQTGEMRSALMASFGEGFTVFVDKFYPSGRALQRRLALDAEQKAITYGIPELYEGAKKAKKDAGLEDSEQHSAGPSTQEEISRRQANLAVDERKKILLTFIDQQIELVQSRQLQSQVKLQQADSLLVRFDLQLRYRAALTRDLRKAIEAFLHYNRSLRPGK